jgi:hypothetical protein
VQFDLSTSQPANNEDTANCNVNAHLPDRYRDVETTTSLVRSFGQLGVWSGVS